MADDYLRFVIFHNFYLYFRRDVPENFRLLVGGHDLNDTMNNEYFYIDQIFIVRGKLSDLVQTLVYNSIFLTVLKINCIIFFSSALVAH